MSDSEVTAAARRLLGIGELFAKFERNTKYSNDLILVATWALEAGAIEHVNCNAVKPCACRCSVCAVPDPEPAAPPVVPPHDDAKGG